MRSIVVLVILFCAVPQAAPAQTHPVKKAEPERLGMTCAQILQMSSADWVARYVKEKSAAANATARGLAVYSECYEARTNRLAASLGKNAKGPLMSARGNFRDFELALEDFTAKALAATNPPADAVKTATAALYEKQFRNDFYRSYTQQSPKSSAQPANATTTKPAGNVDGIPAANPPTSSASPTPPAAAPDNAEPMTKAKNRFGELLDALPEDKLREIHKAFGRIFSGGPVSDATKLAVYRYAIFCLEPASATPFSPPPF
jgi:hypothetical protein